MPSTFLRPSLARAVWWVQSRVSVVGGRRGGRRRRDETDHGGPWSRRGRGPSWCRRRCCRSRAGRQTWWSGVAWWVWVWARSEGGRGRGGGGRGRAAAAFVRGDNGALARSLSSFILAWTVQDKLVFPALLALALVVALVVVDHEPDKLLPAARLRLSLAHLAGTAMPVKPQAAYLDQLARDKRDFVAALDTSTSTRDWVVAVGNEAGGALLLHSLSLRPRGSLPDLGSHTQTSTRSRPPSPTPTLPPSASPPRPRAALSPSSSPPAPICTSAPRTSSPSRPQASRATSSSPSTTSPRPRPRLPPPSPPAPASPSSTTTRSSPPSAPTRPTRPTRPTTRASHPSSTTTPTRGGTSARARAGSR